MDNGLIEENNYKMFKKDNKLFQFDLDRQMIKTKKDTTDKKDKNHKKT